MLPADYTRCMGIDCPDDLSEKCARHRDIPDEPTGYRWTRSCIDPQVRCCAYFIPWEQP